MSGHSRFMNEPAQDQKSAMDRFEGKGDVLAVMSAKENNIDYLGKLPTEIWFEILSSALLSLPPDSPFEFDPFRLDTLPSQEILYSYQYMRLDNLVTCKTLLPLMEQLLFTDVILREQGRYELFLKRATANTGSGRYQGEWKKRIYVSTTLPAMVFVRFDSLFTSCPNLTSLDLGYRVIVRSYDSYMQKNMTKSLRHLLWRYIYFDWSILQLVSIHFPNLIQLGIWDYKEISNFEDRSVVFKSLRHFIASYEVVTYAVSSKLIMPSLRIVNLVMSAEHTESMDHFFIQNGLNITTLRLTEALFTFQPHVFPMGSRLLDSVCPSLRTLEFNTSVFDPIHVSDDATSIIIPHQQLTHLKLMFDWSHDATSGQIQNHARYFSSKRFPNFRFVTGIPRETTHQRDIQAFLEGVFPNKIVDIDLTRDESFPYR